jgi:hypothetical protein
MSSPYPSFAPQSAGELRYNQATDFWQERDFGQKFSAVFEFLRAHWRSLGRVLLYLVGPLALLQAIAVVVLQYHLFGSVSRLYHMSSVSASVDFLQFFTSPAYFSSTLLGAAFYTVLVLSIYGYLLECLYPTQPGQPLGVAEVWAVVKRRCGGFLCILYSGPVFERGAELIFHCASG